MFAENEIVIRKYSPQDRQAVRKISYDTSFLENPHQIVQDEEILADCLTKYFTDYEPESCLVAIHQGRVVGYFIGTKNSVVMNRVYHQRIIPRILVKAICKGTFLNNKTAKFIFYSLQGFLKGEFFTPDFSKQYPANLHINIEKEYRGSHIGRRLLEQYFQFLKENKIPGVMVGSLSEGARNFFERLGFHVLYQSRRSYLRYFLEKDIPYCILVKDL